jgi:hypothetical protein
MYKKKHVAKFHLYIYIWLDIGTECFTNNTFCTNMSLLQFVYRQNMLVILFNLS